MTTVADIDVRALPRFQRGNEAPLWWGIVLLIAIEATVVANFVASYLYLRMEAPQWPPAGIEPPPLLWPTISLVLLLSSCVTMWLAGRFINQDRRWPFVAAIWASVALDSLVLLLRWWQFEQFQVGMRASAYGSILWTITGFHFVHVVSAVIGTAVVGVLGMLGFFNSKRQIAVVVDTMYWYFVSIAWVPFYLVLYWVPRWL